MDIILGGIYKVQEKIGRGSFGDIYLGINIQTNQKVAIKLESTKNKYPQLEYESKIYQAFKGGVGIPQVYWYGREGDQNILAIDLLGPSLEDLFNQSNRKFSLKTTLMLANQMISRVEYMHAKEYIHRDIKPDNFLIGLGKKVHLVHVIDFGLTRKYIDSKTQLHIPYKEGKSLIGTVRYTSVNTHLGVEQSRRDDLEGIGYVLIYFLKGELPWQGLSANTKQEKYEKIKMKKIETSSQELCQDLPYQFQIYINYCKNLKFEEKPDYTYLKVMFKELLFNLNHQYDFVFDWVQLNSVSLVIQNQLNQRQSNSVIAGNQENKLVQKKQANYNQIQSKNYSFSFCLMGLYFLKSMLSIFFLIFTFQV